MQYHILAYKKKTLMGLNFEDRKMVTQAKKIEFAFNKKYRCGDSGEEVCGEEFGSCG